MSTQPGVVQMDAGGVDASTALEKSALVDSASRENTGSLGRVLCHGGVLRAAARKVVFAGRTTRAVPGAFIDASETRRSYFRWTDYKSRARGVLKKALPAVQGSSTEVVTVAGCQSSNWHGYHAEPLRQRRGTWSNTITVFCV